MRTTRSWWGGAPRVRAAIALAGIAAMAACAGDSPAEPGIDIDEITGTWVLTRLAFDPQGILPEADILTALGIQPQLIVTPGGTAQLVYQNPASGLFKVIQGTVRTTPSGMRVDFERGAGYDALLLSRQMTFELQPSFDQNAPVLSFTGSAPDGVSRQRLVQLVQSWQSEQLLDPVPGMLNVRFTRQ